MVAYKSIVTSLVVILIFSCGVSGRENKGCSSGYRDKEIENKEAAVTNDIESPKNKGCSSGYKDKEMENKEAAVTNDIESPKNNGCSSGYKDKEMENKEAAVTNDIETCKKLLNRIYSEDDHKVNENFYVSYKKLNYDVISSYLDVGISLARMAHTDSSLNAANIWEFQIQILDDFFKYLIDHHSIDFKGKEQSPNKFCVDTAKQEFVYLNVNLKETETTSQKLAAVCIGLMKTIGIEEPDSATTELAFKMVYLNLYESILSYEGMTNIGQNDEKIDVIRNSEQKNRNLVMNTSDRTHHEKKRQKTCEHTIEERNDLDVYIKMFLKKYFQYFLDIIDTQKKTSAITNVTIESYCRNRGVQLVDESGVKIPQKKKQ